MKRGVLVFVTCLLAAFLFSNAMGQPGQSNATFITTDPAIQGWPEVAYDTKNDMYLVVWEDYRNDPDGDIWGQFVNGDGTLAGENFAICATEGYQYCPHLVYNRGFTRFLVVFEDNRDGESDIRGVFVDGDTGAIEPIAASDPGDGSFPIASNPEGEVYAPSVAYNWIQGAYLVVWEDYRDDVNGDVYGQVLDVAGYYWTIGSLDEGDPTVNFPISSTPGVRDGMPDVSYSSVIDEWFVVFGVGIGEVYGQRIDLYDALVNPDGTAVAKTSGVTQVFESAIPLATGGDYGPETMMPRCAFNDEYPGTATASEGWCEVETIWTDEPGLTWRDVVGQRVGFFPEGSRFEARRIDRYGVSSEPYTSNHLVSNAYACQYKGDLGYGKLDGEWLVGFSDVRTNLSPFVDLYGQRLWVDPSDTSMAWLSNNRLSPVETSQNFQIHMDPDTYAGSHVGVAHGSGRNEFLMVYTYEADPIGGSLGDIWGIRFYGTAEGTPVKEAGNAMPEKFQVHANYPNPFNPETTIRFSLPHTGRVRAAIYDLMGRRIATLADEEMHAGPQSVVWYGKDDLGKDVVSGLYFYEVRYEDQVFTKKMTLIR